MDPDGEARDGGGGDADADVEADFDPPPIPDRDEDGIEDGWDVRPDEPDEPVAGDDFEGDLEGWTPGGGGDWSDSGGALAQNRECASFAGLATFEKTAIGEQDVYVEARVRLSAPGECGSDGAGVVARKAGGDFVACLFTPGEQSTDRVGNGESCGTLQLFVFEGDSLETAVPDRLADHTGCFDEFAVSYEEWSDRFATVRLSALANRLTCGARIAYRTEIDKVWDPAVEGIDPSPLSGAAGVATWGTSAVFDDFLAVSQ